MSIEPDYLTEAHWQPTVELFGGPLDGLVIPSLSQHSSRLAFVVITETGGTGLYLIEEGTDRADFIEGSYRTAAWLINWNSLKGGI